MSLSKKRKLRQFTREYLILGEALAAFDYASSFRDDSDTDY